MGFGILNSVNTTCHFRGFRVYSDYEIEIRLQIQDGGQQFFDNKSM